QQLRITLIVDGVFLTKSVDELFRTHELLTIPFMTGVNNDEGDAGAPVYLYEYQHSPRSMQTRRPSFVGSDHGDEILTVFGFCFTTTHVTLTGKYLSFLSAKLVLTCAWACRSPNGDGLVHWPKYGAEEDYLSIDVNEQVTGQHLKKDKFVFLTRTLPEKIRQHKEKEDRCFLCVQMLIKLLSDIKVLASGFK
uniref:Carboxylesterase type B domain-containing protein n=1 Tax=Cyclopterus lumpus TaxID=8103 RepID=A0A8C3B3E8_CYCLU